MGRNKNFNKMIKAFTLNEILHPVCDFMNRSTLIKGVSFVIGMYMLSITALSAQVSVTATAGTVGPTSYTTLKGAFDAINAGTHQGVVAISLSGNTTETASAVLNSGVVAPAAYTSVSVKATVPVTVSGSIVGAVIKLNGADNVTIDGRIAGSGRNITVQNTSTSAATAAVWLSSVAVGNGCVNNTIRNLELLTGIDPTASSNSTFGIIMCGASISTTSNGIDNDNNSFIANRVMKARYGIVTRGTTTDLNLGIIVTDNIIGPSAFGTDQISKVGIFMQADNGAIVSRNTIQFVGVLEPQAATGSDRIGIAIGSEAWSVTSTGVLTSLNYVVTNNIIHDIVEENTFSSLGILLGTTQSGGATNNLVANNMIYNVRANGTSGDQICGIGIAGGNGDKIVNNSISITGDQDPGASTASSTNGNAMRISTVNATNNANFQIMNNSIYLDASSSSTPGMRFYAITLTSAAYVFGTGGLNYNNYYINSSNVQLQTGALGTATTNAQTTQFATLANWKLALTAPQDANSIQADPQYISNTGDLHIGSSSPNLNVGVTIGAVPTDIDGNTRPQNSAYEIGADELFLQFCAGTPNPGNTLTSASSVCAGGSITLSLQNLTPGIGVTYQWRNISGPIMGATNPTFTVAVNTPDSFKCVVTCSASSSSGTSIPVAIFISPNPVGGTATGPTSAVTSTNYVYSVTGSTGSLQWQFATALAGPFSNVPGPTSTTPNVTLSFGSAGTFFIRCRAFGTGCTDAFSNIITTVVTIGNDNVCDALTLNIGANGQYTNAGATAQEGEPSLPETGCNTQTGWCPGGNTQTNSVWFKINPAISGKYSFLLSAVLFDSQFALYSAEDCSDFSSFVLIAANDDRAGSPFESFLEPICLFNGTTYYLKVDGYQTTQASNWGILVTKTLNAQNWYPDTDGDLYGDANEFIFDCTAPQGYIATGGDCNDSNPNIHPGAQEICDGIDNDCDGDIDDEDGGITGQATWYIDFDQDGYGAPDGFTLACNSPEGYVSNDDDCDDEDNAINPQAAEVCDNVDNNCNQQVDEVCGCTDPSAHNYDETALLDDGSCIDCKDGIINGDETGYDCGGSLCDPCPPPVAVCGNIVTVYATPGNLIYNGPGSSDVYLIPASALDAGSTSSAGGGGALNVKRTLTNVAFNWTTNGACIDAIPNGVYNNNDKGLVYRTCLPVTPADFNKIRNFDMQITDMFGSSMCSGRYKVVYSGGTNPINLDGLEALTRSLDDENFSVYPNPGSDQVYIEIAMDTEVKYNLSIYDTFGKLVTSMIIESSLSSIDTQNFMPGTYTIMLKGGDEIKTTKWIKIQ